MALIECPECKDDVSTSATACPHCGFQPIEAPDSPDGNNAGDELPGHLSQAADQKRSPDTWDVEQPTYYEKSSGFPDWAKITLGVIGGLIAVGFTAFLLVSWVFVDEVNDSMRAQNVKTARIEIDKLSGLVENYYLTTSPKRLPDKLEDLTTGLAPLTKNIPQDPWGNAYIYRPDDEREFELFSAGPDTKPDTADDVRPDET